MPQAFPVFAFLVLAFALQSGLMLILKRKQLFQRIYELTPKSHQEKTQTPSFGGLGILGSVLIGSIWLPPGSLEAWWVLSIFVVFSIIGFLDDLLSMSKRENSGFSARHKIVLQVGFAIFFLLVFSSVMRPLAWWEFGVYLFLIVGSSNAANLTDGLDGLLAGLSMMTFVGFFLFFSGLPHPIAQNLCILLSGAVGIFLIFNRHPARIFMGDTGSLAIGASFGALALVADHPLILLPLGIVYIIETLSVILQVISFKIRKKRIFLMAPLHHHLELLGLPEKVVVWFFWCLGLVGLLLFYFS